MQRQAWNCSFNVLRAHAAAVKEFRAAVPGGRISICLNSEWAVPFTNSAADAVSSGSALFDKIKEPLLTFPAITCLLCSGEAAVDF